MVPFALLNLNERVPDEAVLPAREPPARIEPDDGPVFNDCPSTATYCEDACAGRPLPIVGRGCPVPRCLCEEKRTQVVHKPAVSVSAAAAGH